MLDRLRQILAASPEVSAGLEEALDDLNGATAPAGPHTFRELERLLAGQHYRLGYWQTVSDTINYRRFFSITDLVGMCVDDPAVFEATHDLAISLSIQAGCRPTPGMSPR